MEHNDLRKRATWLRAVAARLPSKDVAGTLTMYADELSYRAARLERYQSSSQRQPAIVSYG